MKKYFNFSCVAVIMASLTLLFISSCEQQVIEELDTPTTQIQDDLIVEGEEEDAQEIKIIFKDVVYKNDRYNYEAFVSDEVVSRSILDVAVHSVTVFSPEDYELLEELKERSPNQDISIALDIHMFDNQEEEEFFIQSNRAKLDKLMETDSRGRYCFNDGDYRLDRATWYDRPYFHVYAPGLPRGKSYSISGITESSKRTITGNLPSWMNDQTESLFAQFSDLDFYEAGYIRNYKDYNQRGRSRSDSSRRGRSHNCDSRRRTEQKTLSSSWQNVISSYKIGDW